VTKVVGGIASLPFMKRLSSAQVRGKLGYMKIVDTAANSRAHVEGFDLQLVAEGATRMLAHPCREIFTRVCRLRAAAFDKTVKDDPVCPDASQGRR
jgi:hypothetical protein